jgi:hypothetical protein
MELEALLVIIIFLFVAITVLLGTTVVVLYHRIKEMFDLTKLLTVLYEKEREKTGRNDESFGCEISGRIGADIEGAL